MLKFSRDDEREADRVGARIMRQAGWDSRGDDCLHGDPAPAAGTRSRLGRGLSLVASGAGRARRALRSELRNASGGRRDSEQFRQIRTQAQPHAAGALDATQTAGSFHQLPAVATLAATHWVTRYPPRRLAHYVTETAQLNPRKQRVSGRGSVACGLLFSRPRDAARHSEQPLRCSAGAHATP